MGEQTNFEFQLQQIEKRRWQLWFLAFLIIIAFAVTVSMLSYWGAYLPSTVSAFTNQGVIRFALLSLSIAFCVYITEREIIFRRLSRQLVEEQVKISWLNQKVKQASSLLQAGKAVNSFLDAKKVSSVVLKAAFDLLGATQGSVMLVNERSGLLEIINSFGLNPAIVARTRIKVGESISGWVVQKGKPLLLTGAVDPKKYTNFAKKARFIQSAIVVPLKAQDKTIGVLSLSVGGKSGKKFDKFDLNNAQIFAEQVASAIVNAKLYEQSKKSQNKFAALNKELASKNDELKKANHELKAVNDELEKFNQITVDRELQMVRLKDEIRRLSVRAKAS